MYYNSGGNLFNTADVDSLSIASRSVKAPKYVYCFIHNYSLFKLLVLLSLNTLATTVSRLTVNMICIKINWLCDHGKIHPNQRWKNTLLPPDREIVITARNFPTFFRLIISFDLLECTIEKIIQTTLFRHTQYYFF